MGAVDISVLGDKALARRLDRLNVQLQKKIARQAIRASAKRSLGEIVHNIQRQQLVLTGRLLEAFRAAKIRSGAEQRNLIRIGPVWPERSELGISPRDKHYYPMAVEMGHGSVPAHPYVRPAIDENREKEIDRIGREIGAGIEREAVKGG